MSDIVLRAEAVVREYPRGRALFGPREEAVTMLCQMVGAVMISRSVSQVNKDLSGEVLTLSSARPKRAWQR